MTEVLQNNLKRFRFLIIVQAEECFFIFLHFYFLYPYFLEQLLMAPENRNTNYFTLAYQNNTFVFLFSLLSDYFWFALVLILFIKNMSNLYSVHPYKFFKNVSVCFKMIRWRGCVHSSWWKYLTSWKSKLLEKHFEIPIFKI